MLISTPIPVVLYNFLSAQRRFRNQLRSPSQRVPACDYPRHSRPFHGVLPCFLVTARGAPFSPEHTLDAGTPRPPCAIPHGETSSRERPGLVASGREDACSASEARRDRAPPSGRLSAPCPGPRPTHLPRLPFAPRIIRSTSPASSASLANLRPPLR